MVPPCCSSRFGPESSSLVTFKTLKRLPHLVSLSHARGLIRVTGNPCCRLFGRRWWRLRRVEQPVYHVVRVTEVRGQGRSIRAVLVSELPTMSCEIFRGLLPGIDLNEEERIDVHVCGCPDNLWLVYGFLGSRGR